MKSPTSNASKVQSGTPQKATTSIRPRTRFLANLSPGITPKITAAILGLVCTAATASANLLVDPGFENNPLTTYGNVFSNFTLYQGQWGAEAATITGPDPSGVNPAGGSLMLRETSDGGTTTQTVQATDVTSFQALIDAGGATVTLSALFNAVDNLPLSSAAVLLHFYSGSSLGTGTSSISTSLTVDGFPNTWDQISTSGAIPVGTRWMVSEVLFNNASLSGNPGFVDGAELTIAPEPSSALLLIGSGIMFLVRRRRAASVSAASPKQARNN